METKENDFDEASEKLNILRRKLMPWQKEIMITLFIILILLVVFLGYAYGGMKVCSDLDGILDDKFKCHPNFLNQTPKLIAPEEYAIPIFVNFSDVK